MASTLDFVSSVIENIHYIRLPKVIDKESYKDFDDRVVEWEIVEAEYLVFDFKFVTSIHSRFYPSFSKFVNACTNKQMKVKSINMSRELIKQIEDAGLANIFNPVKVKKSVAKSSDGGKAADHDEKKAKFNEKLVEAFSTQTKRILEQFASGKVKWKQGFFRRKEEDLSIDIKVISIISFKEENAKGNIRICFSQESLLELYKGMMEEDAQEINEEVIEISREILNVILGAARRELVDQHDVPIDVGLPNTLTVDEIKNFFALKNFSSGYVLPFEVGGNMVLLEIYYE